ncbi:MAG: FIST signal transduction protein [Chloroflexota bacterium]
MRVAVGQAQALDAREAAAQAARQALEQIGREPAVIALVMASHHYPIQMVVNGLASVLSDVPLFGCSTLGEISGGGCSQRSIVVALLCGDIQARAEWWPGYAEDSQAVARNLTEAFQLGRSNDVLLVAADGTNGDAQQLCAGLPVGDYRLFGCLAGGAVDLHRTYQIGGRKSGVNGLSAALLTGEKLAVGIGQGHGWLPLENYAPVTQSSGLWIKSVDQRSPAEFYAQWLGFSPDEWRVPPLSQLVRLYPLALKAENGAPIVVRSPLCLDEVDGNLQMHATIPEGSAVCLMVGSSERCLQAAEDAAHQALEKLGSAKPLLALVFVDVAWQMLMEAQPASGIQAVRQIIGENVPVIGGYTFGQVARGRQGAEFFNQNFSVMLLAET